MKGKSSSTGNAFFTQSVTYLLEGVARNCLECLLDIYSFFGAGLKVRDVVLTLAPSLSPFGGDLRAGGGRGDGSAVSFTSISPKDSSLRWYNVIKINAVINWNNIDMED